MEVLRAKLSRLSNAEQGFRGAREESAEALGKLRPLQDELKSQTDRAKTAEAAARAVQNGADSRAEVHHCRACSTRRRRLCPRASWWRPRCGPSRTERLAEELKAAEKRQDLASEVLRKALRNSDGGADAWSQTCQ